MIRLTLAALAVAWTLFTVVTLWVLVRSMETPPRTVLWGARRRDVVYGSRAWRRRNIPIGAHVIAVTSTSPFDVGNLIMFTARGGPPQRVAGVELLQEHPPPMFDVVGIEPGRLGVNPSRKDHL